MNKKHAWESKLGYSRLLKSFLILACVLVIHMAGLQSVYAETATVDEMERVCQNWLSYIVSEQGRWGGGFYPNIISVQDIIENDTLLGRYYAISPKGYVIVPVLKELPPVKVYSDECSLDINEPDGFALMIRQVLKDRLRLYTKFYGSLEAGQDATDQPLFGHINSEKWDALSVPSGSFKLGGTKSQMESLDQAGPLLTTGWHQDAPYNNLCPLGYQDDRCVVGCVATAAAQIVWHHQWPPVGEGSHSYYWNGDNSCEGGSTPGEQLSADFSDPYSYESGADAAELCYEMGVAFDMDYGVCGSGAYTLDGATVFPTYFRYDWSTTALHRDNYNQPAWFNIIKNEINRGRPILYQIYTHAIVCDGWREAGELMEYHFNYGWGGSHNAWYAVDNLYCPWEGCDPMVEAMVVNIIPKTALLMLGSDEISDVAGGDGDGIPEAGETIEITITVANFGADAVSDLSVEMFMDDGSISVIDGTTQIGYIAANDSADNSSDPFEITIPPDYISRIDSLLFEMTWIAGEEQKTDTMAIERVIGAVSILLVDDDVNDTLDVFYRNNFENLRLPYDMRVPYTQGSPDSALLCDYDIVCWFTGDFQTQPLTGNEIAATRGYMNAGGKLFLTGQGIAAALNASDPDFLNNYLRSEYVKTDYVPLLMAVPGAQLFDIADTLVIYGSGGASNQTAPDYIAPINGSVAELSYHSSTDNAAVSYSASYRLVFFAFGFESISVYSGQKVNQDVVFARILDFFSYQNPAQCPEIVNLVPWPGEPMNLVEHNPDIIWSYYDESSAPQTAYHLQVDDDSNWAAIGMWDLGPISGDDTSVVYAGSELLDGEKYYIRVRAYNGNLWSGWRYLGIRMNSRPSIPTNLTPRDLDGVTDATPLLSLDNSIDNEFDAVTYSFEVYDDTLMTTLITSIDGIVQGYIGVTTWEVDVTLDDDEDYFWRVMANDGYETTDWTELVRFWVNSFNHEPTAFNLVSPENEGGGSVLPTFVWEVSTDADLYDIVYYTLYYADNPAFYQPVTVSGLTTSEYTVTDTLRDSLYYWKVAAEDLFNGRTTSDSTFIIITVFRGDANSDGNINIGDAVYVINLVFKDGPPPQTLTHGDANCDGNVNIGDAVYVINFVFKDGPGPGCP